MSFLGNFLILVALHKVSSLHPPSKLLQRCLATTDLLVSIVSQPFIAPYWMSLVHKEWYLCRFAYKATYIQPICIVFSVDRLLALLSGLRNKQIQCNFEAHILRGRNLLGAVWCHWFKLHFRLPNRYVVLPFILRWRRLILPPFPLRTILSPPPP